MTETKPTSTEVIYALVEAKALGKLTISGDGIVTITGPQADRDRAREVLADQGLTCTRHPGRDEWSC
jgi:hypothetical protein